MSDADDMERLLIRATEHYAAEGFGELDAARVYQALRTLLAAHRSAGTQVDRMVELGASLYGRPWPEDPNRIEFRLGWANDCPMPQRAGRSVHLGHLPLAELIRGPGG